MHQADVASPILRFRPVFPGRSLVFVSARSALFCFRVPQKARAVLSSRAARALADEVRRSGLG